MAFPPVEPTFLHSHLMDALHTGLGHPRIAAPQKASYAKILAMLAADQAKAHAQAQTPGAAPGQNGGVASPEDSGYPAGETAALPGLGAINAHPFTAPQSPLLAALQARLAPQSNPLLGAFQGHAYAAPQNPLLTALAGHAYG